MVQMLWIPLTLLAASPPKNINGNGNGNVLVEVEVDVCLSPGCLADGAQGALSKLKALAPPAVSVREGKCVSLCGKGPVLIQNPDEIPKRRVVLRNMNDDKLVPFLNGLIATEQDNDDADVAAADEERLSSLIPDDLVEGYDLIAKGTEMVSEKSFSEASEHLRAGIDKAFEVSKAWGGDMEWMIEAHRTLADSLLQQGPEYYDDALTSVQVALELSSEDFRSYTPTSHLRIPPFKNLSTEIFN